MIFNLASSHLIIDGAQSWYGEVSIVGPGVCGGNASFVQMGYVGCVLSSAAVNSMVSLSAAVAVCFQGAHDGDIVPLIDEEGLYA